MTIENIIVDSNGLNVNTTIDLDNISFKVTVANQLFYSLEDGTQIIGSSNNDNLIIENGIKVELLSSNGISVEVNND